LLHFDDDGLPVAVGRLDGHDVTASHYAFQISMWRHVPMGLREGTDTGTFAAISWALVRSVVSSKPYAGRYGKVRQEQNRYRGFQVGERVYLLKP
jgi:hypothetical protein